MAVWSGLGMNYGHQAVYDSSVVESDFTFLKSQGITRLRIAMPPYTTSLTNCQDMVTRALAHGFYVAWGMVASTTITATDWTAFKSYVTGTLATWAQSNGLSELLLGNEAELHVDGTTITATTVRADIRSMATTVKGGSYTGKVSYSTSISGTYRTPWISEGIGALDLIGWNSYDTLTNFQNRNPVVVSAFGANTYISEFGAITLGYGDYNDENAYATDVLARITSMQSNSVSVGYFFCYRDGGFGLTPNTFALVQSSGVARCVRGAILNTPGQKIFSSFAM